MTDLAPLLDFEGAEALLDAWCAGIAPDPDRLVWEWADEHVVLPAISAAEAGRYDSSRTPYLREILTNLSPSSPVISTILMKGSQIGASQAGLVLLMYIIAVGGGPALVVCPTIGMAELYSKQRLQPLLAECELARAKVPTNTGKNSGNTLLLKTFPGGMVRLTGGNSASSLKSMPAKWAIYEEPDEFPEDLEGQGNAVDMVRRRLTTYGLRAKEFANCTPSLKSGSIIHQLHLSGDRREYTMPCPHCRRGTVFNKELFRFKKARPETAHMVCMHADCARPIDEARHKTAMMAAGEWVPAVKDAPPGTPRSYYLPAFYSPVGWESWENIARLIEAAEGNYAKTKTVWNQVYGLPWDDVTDTPDHTKIWERRSRAYRMREIPPGVVFLAAGIDVGVDHIEIGVWGFGRKGRRWLIEHVRIRGRYQEEETWRQAEAFLRRRYWHPFGAALPIRRAGVDRGKWPDVVMPWVRRQDPDWIVAVRGSQKLDAPILTERAWKTKTDGGLSVDERLPYFDVGVGMLKLELYGQLNLGRGPIEDEPPPGWVEVPEDVDLGWCEQLVAEDYVTVTTKAGRPRSTWKPKGGVRSEALDCANYARSVAELVGWSFWTDHDFAREEERVRLSAEDLRLAMERLARRRARKGDARRVTVDDIVGSVAWPAGAEAEGIAMMIEQEPPEDEEEERAPPPPAPADDDEDDDDGTPGVPWARFLRKGKVGEGGVERPTAPGIVGCAKPGKGLIIPRPRAWSMDDDD